MPPKQPQIFVVEDTESARLDRWLKRQIPHLGQGLLEKLLRQGKIKLNDKKVKSSERIQNGDVVNVYIDLASLQEKLETITPVKKPTPELALSSDEIAWLESLVIWEDEDFLVLNKPSGLAVQGGSKTTKHIDGYLQALGKIKNKRYRLVHRLDRDTSGVFIIAKTLGVATHLTELFKEGNIFKTYWAVVLGHPKPGIGKVKAPLIKEKADKEKMVVDEKHGKKAITVYRTVKKLISKRKPELTWLELNPETGRTHQIRVHCQYIGCPIIGDGKYGGREATEVSKNMHLHARAISVTDCNGNKFTFTAPPPKHFEETLLSYNIDWSKNLHS
ncbi:RluA family pseudouridine synthase [Candidatus Paracaedibacter symbiosus]|uniref:RluA family pseudouridine synthase n=1 Tax=Candidatus Paracaedibacter symbiosus TaxID=244582 RepID=UPI00068C58BB|nr:RluA family pseudouridine synthase [Candidatus Paracaedibacter symbiosus]